MAIENSDIQPLLDEIAKVEDEQYRAALLAAVEDAKEAHAETDLSEFEDDISLFMGSIVVLDMIRHCDTNGLNAGIGVELNDQIMQQLAGGNE
ncbi:MAG: hypothetical protein CME70_06000 [Halobacteriovorax sp.]|nr:hypothetical protein [Halobacteriovorax sp.]